MLSSHRDIIFCSFASGSSGNCYFLGSRDGGILIDVGISTRAIQKYLHQVLNIGLSSISAILITHDHADHIRAVGTLGEKIHIPIYATPLIHEGINRNYGVRKKLRHSIHYFEKNATWQLNDMTIQTFGISHDASDCVSYVIDYCGERFMIVTDCGIPNTEMEFFIRTANHLVIEANHDEQMLLNSTYPPYLKQRILSDKGHQSNDVCGEVLERNYHDGLKNIWLCHLSNENNTPERALEAVANHLRNIGVIVNKDVNVSILPRLEPSEVFILNPSENPKT